MFSDVLLYSRLHDGDHQLKSANISLDELIEDAAVSLQSKAKAKNIELYHFDYTGNRELFAERNLLLDALSRLTDNAIKFSPEGSEVELSASFLKDSSVVISVKDKGPGIAMHKIERCMKPFEQADQALTRSEQGLGLGLAISRRIAELHGGKLIVDTQPGKGTTASLWMPASSLVATTVRKAG